MQSDIKKALAYLQQDSLLHADMLSAIQRQTADIRFAAPGGVFLIETGDHVPMLSATDASLGTQLIRQYASLGAIVVHQPGLLPAADQAGLTVHTLCFQAVYTSPHPLPLHCPYPITPLTQEDLPDVMAHYQLIRDPRRLLELIARGHMWGVRDGATLMGFIGIHGEGSMGLLEVFPPYRRMGLAYALESYLINWHIKQGLTPYCQVFEDNAASLALQRKLGLSFSAGRISWAIRPKEA